MTMGHPVQNSEELGLSSAKIQQSIQTELEFTGMRTLVGKYFKNNSSYNDSLYV